MADNMRDVLRALEVQGFTWRRTRRGHIFVTKDGQPVTTFSGTPSDQRAFANSLAAARRAGFRWPV